MRLPLLLLAATAITLVADAPLGATSPAVAPPVQVLLELSEPILDPAHPRGTLQCRVRNGSRERIEVPVGYDGEQVELSSFQLKLLRRIKSGEAKKPPAPPAVRLVPLESGREQVVFELPLAQVFRLDGTPDEEWRWDWRRRSAPPRSPIHVGWGPSFRTEASLFASVTIAGKPLTSPAVTLKVKTAEPSQ